MLTITVKGQESFNSRTQEFVYGEDVVLDLEHSLVSLSKWESKYEKSFLSSDDKTPEETLDYVRIMCLTPDVPPQVFMLLSEENITEINDYIAAKMTATTFSNMNARRSHEIITAEIIYYWMVEMQIDWQAQYWHLNRLLTLIRVVNEKRAPKKKMSPRDAASRQRALNAARRSRYGSSG